MLPPRLRCNRRSGSGSKNASFRASLPPLSASRSTRVLITRAQSPRAAHSAHRGISGIVGVTVGGMSACAGLERSERAVGGSVMASSRTLRY